MKNSNVLMFVAVIAAASMTYVGDWLFFRELIVPFCIFASASLICDTLEKHK